MPKPLRPSIDQLVEELTGTCKSFDEAAEPYNIDDYTHEELQEFDEQVFCCSVCNWWCDDGERSMREDDETCVDCAEDEDD